MHPTAESPPPADHGYPGREHARVRDAAAEFLATDVQRLWPRSRGRDGFRWELVCGEYLRANVDPSDRYVLSLPGTSAFRLRADASGYENLWLAGDWTDNGLNAGCIEAAVVSGLQAANRVLGRPLLERVAGYYQTHRDTEIGVTPSSAP